jgi:hypothetical protein
MLLGASWLGNSGTLIIDEHYLSLSRMLWPPMWRLALQWKAKHHFRVKIALEKRHSPDVVTGHLRGIMCNPECNWEELQQVAENRTPSSPQYAANAETTDDDLLLRGIGPDVKEEVVRPRCVRIKKEGPHLLADLAGRDSSGGVRPRFGSEEVANNSACKTHGSRPHLNVTGYPETQLVGLDPCP